MGNNEKFATVEVIDTNFEEPKRYSIPSSYHSQGNNDDNERGVIGNLYNDPDHPGHNMALIGLSLICLVIIGCAIGTIIFKGWIRNISF